MMDLEKLLDLNQLYIVGVSGGCDSMALLDAMYNKGIKVVVCHVNYHLRDDSDLDQETVSNYCSKYQIPLYVREINKEEYGKDNFQSQARKLRYEFYYQIACK